ncbi:tRNA glutamyl-Q(34) synthetase GluQRS [Alteromonas gilva]|uniref:Glutamyl-Q tRNA(Asp) synthetase n=1 Tax=Alteromonas gilva TaxID=2987522 RepID=A0ABT5L1Q1_9ALTE|nr:tRNA glutamyl-Q(34) synthetase GluQRS [Alteromonas gilva]MDC8829733.1 tRNA glutamyl-Q(34) synthetase GluQRS [Alteromonas gilva]
MAAAQGNTYKGRFAPTPSGDLHFGSFVTAAASYLDARKNHGQWFVRIDDLDTAREVKGSAQAILTTLERFGFEWDGQVSYQSQHTERYRHFADVLLNQHQAYWCECSRKVITARCPVGEYGPVYDGYCRSRAVAPGANRSLRVITNQGANQTANQSVVFNDELKGESAIDLQATLGDFIIKRADGIFSYHLAVVVDDHDLGITHIVRGGDLHPLTGQQVFLQNSLHLTHPQYAHLPIVLDAGQRKLSKSSNAPPIDAAPAPAVLFQALTVLNHSPPDTLRGAPLNELWAWAIAHWQLEKVPGETNMMLPDLTSV